MYRNIGASNLYLTNAITNSMQQSPSWWTNSHSANQ